MISISDLSFPDSVGTQLATITAGLITPQKGQQKRQPRFNRDIMSLILIKLFKTENVTFVIFPSV